MEQKICGVTGHREIPAEYMEQAEQDLRREIEKAIADGYTYFISGFADGADQLFARIVLEKAKENPAAGGGRADQGHAGGMCEGCGYQRGMGFQCLYEAQPLYGRPGRPGDRCL